MTFTADNLPEAAQAISDDYREYVVLDGQTARVLNRLCDSRPGLREWLLNGTAPVATDQPPEVTDEDAERARKIYTEYKGGAIKSMKDALTAHQARVWQTHRPAVDPVRFALDKVAEKDLVQLCRELEHAYRETPSRDFLEVARSKISKILPVAELPKQWAELTDDYIYELVRACWASGMAGGASYFRSAISAYAPPPRRVEVTPEVMKAYFRAYGDEPHGGFSHEPDFEGVYADNLAGMRAALAVANTQANARESEAVAEVARLKGEVERLVRRVADMRQDHFEECEKLTNDARAYETGLLAERDRVERLTKARDEANARADKAESLMVASDAHAAALEALLTVDGVDGRKVKLWLPYERRCKVPFRNDAWQTGCINFMANKVTEYRQTPAPDPELKRWRVRYKGPGVFIGNDTVIIEATRAQAAAFGEVIGEAE